MANTNDKKLLELEVRNMQLEREVAIMKANKLTQSDLKDKPFEIDVLEIWNIIWNGKWLLIGLTTLSVIFTVFYALNLPNIYRSTAIVAPASQSGSSALSKLSGQFGGLASLAGINLSDQSGGNQSIVAMEVIKTWGFVDKFIRDNELEVPIYAAKSWDKSKNKLIYDLEKYNESSKTWNKTPEGSEKQTYEPTSWELYEVFIRLLNVKQDKLTGLISISVEHYSPYLAKDWTSMIVNEINEHLRTQDRLDAIKGIEYLKNQVNQTQIAEMQSVFYQLIEEQTKTLMLTEVGSEYVFKTISPSRVAEVKAKPKRALICIAGLIVGGVFSLCIVILVGLFKKKDVEFN